MISLSYKEFFWWSVFEKIFRFLPLRFFFRGLVICYLGGFLVRSTAKRCHQSSRKIFVERRNVVQCEFFRQKKTKNIIIVGLFSNY